MAELVKASEIKNIVKKKRTNELYRVIEEFNEKVEEWEETEIEDFYIYIKTYLEEKDIIRLFKEAGHKIRFINMDDNTGYNEYEITLDDN